MKQIEKIEFIFGVLFRFLDLFGYQKISNKTRENIEFAVFCRIEKFINKFKK